MRATERVHWPGQTTPACQAHADAIRRLGVALGFTVGATHVPAYEELECQNCLNEASKPKAGVRGLAEEQAGYDLGVGPGNGGEDE